VCSETFYGAPILPHPDYGAIVRVYDGYGEMVNHPGQIRPGLLSAMETVRNGSCSGRFRA